MTIPADVQTALGALIIVILGYITAFFNYRMNTIAGHAEQSKKIAHESTEVAHEASDNLTTVQDDLAALERRLDNLDSRLAGVENREN